MTNLFTFLDKCVFFCNVFFLVVLSLLHDNNNNIYWLGNNHLYQSFNPRDFLTNCSVKINSWTCHVSNLLRGH